MSHVAADCPDRIPPSGTPACQKRHCSSTQVTILDHLLGTVTGTGTGITGPDPSHIPTITQSHSQDSSHITQGLLQIIPQMPSQKHFT